MARTKQTTNPADFLAALEALANAQGLTLPDSAYANLGVERAPKRTTRAVAKRTTRTTRTTRTKRTPAKAPAKRTPVSGVITCDEAWQALGADPTYAPSEPNAPARNGQLWALNAAGKLALID